MKYKPSLALARYAGALLAARTSNLFHPPTWDYLVAVPSSRASLSWRGFSPCHVIAREISQTLGISLIDSLCHAGTNAPQVTCSPQERRVNVRGAFRATSVPLGANVLLVDDVATTGATSAESAFVLLEAGVGRIDLLTLARTPTWQEHRQAIANNGRYQNRAGTLL